MDKYQAFSHVSNCVRMCLSTNTNVKVIQVQKLFSAFEYFHILLEKLLSDSKTKRTNKVYKTKNV